jgi:hypothetical protein
MAARSKSMAMHSRKLLLLGAICWVAPLSAQQRPAVPEQGQSQDCLHEDRGVIAISGSDAVGEVSVFDASRRAFFP